jgi:hypothetical protein
MNERMKKYLAAPLSKDKVIMRAVGLVSIILFFAAARLYDPFHMQLVECQFKHLTGYDCPTCGLTRSVSSLMNFHIAASIAYHPLGIVLAAGLFILLLKWATELLFMTELAPPRGTAHLKMFIVIATSLLFAASWIVKLCAG